MKIVPAIDLKSGAVVRAVGGRRDEYRPIRSTLAADATPDAIGAALIEIGLRQAYVADLDALEKVREPNWDSLDWLLDCGLELWLDVGISSAQEAERLVVFAEARPAINGLIGALESLPDRRLLEQCLTRFGHKRLIFSLDLRGGQPVTAAAEWRDLSPLEIVEDVVGIGVRRLVVLDVTSVGGDQGCPTADLCHSIVERFSDVEVATGGGIRGPDDLQSLRQIGCSAALVSTALHDGRIGRDDLRRFET